MELNEDGFLEELLALRRETWEPNPSSAACEINGLFSSTCTPWPFDGLDSTPPPPAPPPILPPPATTTTTTTSYESFTSSIDPTTLDCSSFPEFPPLISPVGHFPDPTRYPITGPEGEPGSMDHLPGTCKPEPSSFNIGSSVTTTTNTNSTNTSTSSCKSKVKKIEGQPSKNLMAERRRRKRLNDRLSMLRSVVPKISKMDRTSILGDTIDYMKELLDRINSLQEEIDVGSNNPLNFMTIFKDVKSNDVLVRNSPKFDVERRNLDTRVEICCAGKPGLLLSTVTTLEALGLEIQQCVISCFNDFSLQASCSEEMEQRTLMSSEDIKQALFRNAGYGGRCL